MCPFCIGGVVLMAGGSMSAGGLTGLVVNNFRSKRQTKGTVMRLVDSILMEIDQEAQTTKRVLDRIPEDKLAWRPHPKSFSLGQLALHIASVPGSGAGYYGSSELLTAAAQEPPGSSGHFLEKPRECKGHPEENG